MRRNARRIAALAVLLAGFPIFIGCEGRAELPSGNHTVVLITVDDLRADRLPPYGHGAQATPTISRLAVEGTLQPDPIAPSTSRNAALASILTGLAPPMHALSMGSVGRHRLAQRFETLAEVYAEAGFRTLAAVSTRQLTPRLCGFDQGFDLYLSDDLPQNGSSLAPEILVGRVVPELAALESSERVFLWLHFGHLRAEPEGLSAKEDGLVRARLLPFAQTDPELRRELESLDVTKSLVPRVEGVIGRKRGSPAWRALREALHDVQVERLDRALAALLGELSRAGRYEGAVVALAGTRGRYLTEERPDGRVEGFSEGIVKVPMILRAPAPVPLLEGPRSVAAVAPLLRSILTPADAPPVEPVRVYSGEWSVAEVQAEFKLVGKQGSQAIWIRRLDDAVVGMPTPFETVAGGPLPDSSSEVLRVPLGTPVPDGVVLVPDRAAEAWDAPAQGEAPQWSVDVTLDGTWWNVTVEDPERGGGRVLVFAAVDLASDEADPLEARLDPGAVRLSDPALPDAILLGGTLPFAASIKARPRARLGLRVSIAGAEVPVERMRYLSRRFTGSQLTCYVPPWMPERPDWFDTSEAGSPEPGSESGPSPSWAEEPWATISAKRGTGVYRMEGPIDLTPEEVRFLTRMDKSE